MKDVKIQVNSAAFPDQFESDCGRIVSGEQTDQSRVPPGEEEGNNRERGCRYPRVR